MRFAIKFVVNKFRADPIIPTLFPYKGPMKANEVNNPKWEK